MDRTTLERQAKRRLKRVWLMSRRPTARFRTLPDFVIFGAQKAGTTSLYRYLCAHPQVRRAFGQEPTYFSHEIKYAAGLDSYRVNFPLDHGLGSPSRKLRTVTGEASGEYLYYPAAPTRIASDLPNVRLIAILREPADRTISHYFHNVKIGRENDSLEAAIDRELGWHAGLGAPPDADHRAFGALGSSNAYLGRSMYAQHLARWFDVFAGRQIMLIGAEHLYQRPRIVMDQVAQFLEIEPFPRTIEFGAHNQGRRSAVSAEMGEWLQELFVEPNRLLSEMLVDAYATPPDLDFV